MSLSGMGAGVFGGEFDFSWTPDFVDATSTHNAVTEANMTGNLIVGIPIGGTHGANDFVWDVGGGVLGTFNSHIGVGADLRYFHTNSASNEYRFWRGTGGLAFKF